MIRRLMEPVWWEGDGPPVVEHGGDPAGEGRREADECHHRRCPQRSGPGDPPATAAFQVTA